MSGELIDRAALERIIQRAAELQTGEREIGDGLTESDVLDLGSDVGIPARYLKQALVEERLRRPAAEHHGLAHWLVGPQHVMAERVVAQSVGEAGASLDQWMTQEEGLATLRRSDQHLRWERQKGFVAEVRISLSAGGRSYILTRADDIAADIEPLEAGYSHIRLTANVERRRIQRIANASFGVFGGAAISGIWLALGFAAPVAAIPIGVAGVLAVPFLRKHRFRNERIRLGLESVLDRLERNEIPRGDGSKPSAAMFDRVASEIRRALKP